MNSGKILESAAVYVEQLYGQLPEGYNYHKFRHTESVVNECQRLAAESELKPDDSELLLLAAWFHDTGYINGFKDHEEKSIAVAKDFLARNGYDAHKIETVSLLIRETRMPQNPQDQLGMILCDADLSGFGSEDHFKLSKQLRKELRNTQSKDYSDEEWTKQEIDLLTNHKYFTPAAQKLYNAQKEKNLLELKGLLNAPKVQQDTPVSINSPFEDNDKKDKKKKKKKDDEFGRGVETMFRTSTHSHVNLSAMADSKANIMLSINAIVISIVISTLMPKLDSNPTLITPTIILLATCLLAIIFATLSTKPKITTGKFTREDIEQRRANLLFFGNFHSMELEDYEWGMSQMMKDREFLYSAMSKDLYYLGKVLNKKYKYLRICYNVFMYGLIVSVIAFGIALLSIQQAL